MSRFLALALALWLLVPTGAQTAVMAGAQPAFATGAPPPGAAAGSVEDPAGSGRGLPSPISGPLPVEGGVVASSLLGGRDLADRSSTTLWGWPLAGRPEIVRPFDPPPKRWLPGHRGIDLAGVAGERVLAVEDGVVTFSGQIAGVGMVSVTHSDGLRSTYQPVTDRVTRGDRVGRGDRLGVLDVGGHCLLTDCLHLGAVRGRDAYVDPTPLLVGVDLALLPVAP